MVPEKSRSIVGTVALGYDCMTMCWATLYFMFISHYTIYWEYFAVIQNVVSVLLLIKLVPESPKWLYEKGRYVEAKDALVAVARANGVDVAPLQQNQFEGQLIVQESSNMQTRVSLGPDQQDDNEDSEQTSFIQQNRAPS